jgi:flagellar protein FliL
MAEKTTGESDTKSPKESKSSTRSGSKRSKLLSPERTKQLVVIGVIAGGALLGGAGGGLLLGPAINGARAAKASEPAAKEKDSKSEKGEKAKGGKAEKGKGDKGKEGEKGKSKGKEKEKRGGKEGKGPAAVFELENLIVNPAGTEGSRFLMATVAFELDDPKLSELLRENDIAIRDQVITVLENQTMEMLTRPGARDSLRVLLAEAVAPYVEGAEMRVYLPQFVIQ